LKKVFFLVKKPEIPESTFWTHSGGADRYFDVLYENPKKVKKSTFQNIVDTPLVKKKIYGAGAEKGRELLTCAAYPFKSQWELCGE
jgi:hypothetical protein